MCAGRFRQSDVSELVSTVLICILGLMGFIAVVLVLCLGFGVAIQYGYQPALRLFGL